MGTEEKELEERSKKELQDENTTSECVECRILVAYDGWEWSSFAFKRVYKEYYTTSLSEIPLAIDDGSLSKKKLVLVSLQARVTKNEAPCNCEAIVRSKINYVTKNIVWDSWTINWNSLKKALATSVLPTSINSADYGILSPSPLGISKLIHKILLKSLEAKIQEFGHVKENRGELIKCNWETLLEVQELGRLPTIRAIAAEVREDSNLICKILLHFGK